MLIIFPASNKVRTRSLAAAALLAAGLLTSEGRVLAKQGPLLTAAQVADLPVAEPNSPTWATAAAVEVPLLPQSGIMPALTKGTVPKVTVRALRDSGRLAVLL